MEGLIDKKLIAENMKVLRVSQGMTQEDLCNKLFITRTSYSAFESGIKMPDLKTIDSLAQLYNISFDAIMFKDFNDPYVKDLYFGYSTQPLREILTDYESLSPVSKKIVYEKLETLLEREAIFYRDYENIT